MKRGIFACVLGAATCFAAAPAQAARPLPLHPTRPGPVVTNAAAPKAFDGRYVVRSSGGSVRVTDDLTGRSRTQRMPAGCAVVKLRWPELLLACEYREFVPRRPQVLNMIDGRRQEFPTTDDFPLPPFGYPPQRGVAIDDSFSDLGARWIGGRFADPAAKGLPVAVYLSRVTGQRIQRSPAPVYDLGSPDLAEASPACPGPRPPFLGVDPIDPSARAWPRVTSRRHLVVERCGRPAKVIARCTRACLSAVVTRRFVVWSTDREVHVRSRRTGRTFSLRRPKRAELPAPQVTDRRVFVQVAPRQGADRYRVTTIPLPRSLR